jgi:hypothetical protein
MRIYQIIVDEYGILGDQSSDDLSGDDDVSPYLVTDKRAGPGTTVWVSGDESDALFSLLELAEEEETTEVM